MPPVVLPFPGLGAPRPPTRRGPGRPDQRVRAQGRQHRALAAGAGHARFTPGRLRQRCRSPRGQLVVDNYLLSVWGDKVVRTTTDGISETLGGLALPGTGPVTMARNLATPVEVVAVADGQAYWLDLDEGPTGEVKDYPLPTAGDPLGTVN